MLHKTRVAIRFRAKKSSPDYLKFCTGMPVVRTDGHVITKFSRMGSSSHFLTHGAPLRTLRARELRYKCLSERELFLGKLTLFWKNDQFALSVRHKRPFSRYICGSAEPTIQFRV